MTFRIQTASFFLTYPQCPLDFDYVYDQLREIKYNDIGVDLVCVGRELHEDGQPHYHAYVKFQKKINLRNIRFFDLTHYHPNIQACKKVNECLKYVTKDGEYKANFELKIKYTLKECLLRANDEKEFIDLGLQSMDWKFGYGFNSLLKLWEKHQKEKKLMVFQPLYDYSTFRINDVELICHLSGIITHAKDGGRTKSIWLYGPSRTGKTALARSVGVHSYLHEIWNADNIADEATYCVFDDFEWDVLKRQYKSLLGCMKDITITDKYRSKKNLVYNMPAIVLSNTLPVFSIDELDWLNHNVYFHEIKNRIY